MMNKIKFSHTYNKFNRIDFNKEDIAILMQCFKIHHDELNSVFKNYDTAWSHGAVTEWYELPKSDLIVLLFRHTATDTVFTTIRRYTPDKFEYYKFKQGDYFQIHFNDGVCK